MEDSPILVKPSRCHAAGGWVPASAHTVWRRFLLCINYTARPPADSNCRGCVGCNEVLNNEGSVFNLDEK